MFVDVAPSTLPTEVSKKLSVFDRFASRASDFVSRGWFFPLCVLLVVWAPSFLLLNSKDTWQLIITCSPRS
jgi:low affinity Fe/Cu permease